MAIYYFAAKLCMVCGKNYSNELNPALFCVNGLGAAPVEIKMKFLIDLIYSFSVFSIFYTFTKTCYFEKHLLF